MLFVANFKANKNTQNSIVWLSEFHKNHSLGLGKPIIIIAPSFTALESTASFVKKHSWKFPVYVCAQDVSEYGQGSYTGEVNGEMIKNLASHVIIGHSERRRLFAETPQVVNKKIEQANLVKLTTIVCVSTLAEYSQADTVLQNNALIAYEPAAAIGTGKAQDPKFAFKVLSQIKKSSNAPVLYGGSVTHENVFGYISQGGFDGVLVGKGSLDPVNFLKLIEYAGKV